MSIWRISALATLSRTYSSEWSQLALMRDFAREACRLEWNAPGDETGIGQLLLALHEAAANVIEHAYQGQAGQPIGLRLETNANQICLTLLHQSSVFDPATAPPPQFDGSRESGFGVFMIERLVDEVTYFREAEGCSAVRLTKRRGPSHPGANHGLRR
jgi:anti-sigma regulatory factor (Ser/Thr protein kinase)